MEIWKPLKNFPSYNGSSEGRIMNIKTQRILKTFVNNKGYVIISLRKNNKQYTVKVARVIAETFLGEYPGMDICYKDLDRSNVQVDNLEWCTRSEAITRSFEFSNRLPSRGTPIRIVETSDVYRSVSDCARDIDCDRSEIFKCLAGKRDNIKGYHFERI